MNFEFWAVIKPAWEGGEQLYINKAGVKCDVYKRFIYFTYLSW